MRMMKQEEYDKIRAIVRAEIRQAVADFVKDMTLAMVELRKEAKERT